MSKRKKLSIVKVTFASRVFDVLNVMLMIFLLILFIYPFWNQLVLSFNTGADAVKGGFYLWPRDFTLSNYAYAFSMGNILESVFYSVARVLIGTVSNLFVCGLFAYVVMLPTFAGRKFMRLVLILTMYVPIGLIPMYIVLNSLHLLNTFAVYWVPSLITGWNVLMISSFMQGLPFAVVDSARLDGAGEMYIYWRVILPMSVPVFAAMAVIVGVGHWNSWFDVMVYNAKGTFDTLQMYLRRILLKADLIAEMMSNSAAHEELRKLQPQTVRAAVTVIITVPVACIYPFMQRYFVQGMTIGAVKG